MQDRSRLARAFAAYEQALAGDDRADVARARLNLVAALHATGWESPAEVRDQVWRDERTVREAEQQPPVAPYPTDSVRAVSHRPPAATARETAARWKAAL